MLLGSRIIEYRRVWHQVCSAKEQREGRGRGEEHGGSTGIESWMVLKKADNKVCSSIYRHQERLLIMEWLFKNK